MPSSTPVVPSALPVTVHAAESLGADRVLTPTGALPCNASSRACRSRRSNASLAFTRDCVSESSERFAASRAAASFA